MSRRQCKITQGPLRTIDIYDTSTVADEAVGSREDVVKADTQSDPLYDLLSGLEYQL